MFEKGINLKKIAVIFIIAIFLAGGNLVYISTPVWAGYQSYKEMPEEKKKLAKETMAHLLSMGYTHESAAGVLGNVNQESTFDHKLMQNPSMKSILESDPCKLSKGEGGGAVGFFQLDGSRRTAQFCWMHKKGKKWDDLNAQLDYALKVDFKENGDPFANSTYVKRIKSRYCPLAPGVDCSKAPDSFKGGSKGFKKMEDPEMAAIAWGAVWERHAWNSRGNVPLRVSFAKEAYEELKDVKPDSSTGGGDEDDGSNDDKKKSGGGDGDSGRIDDEYDLKGMPEELKWDKGQEIEDAKLGDLDTDEQYYITTLREDIGYQKEGPVRIIQIWVSMLGLICILWGILLLMGTMFDKSNTFIDLKVTRFLTFGRIEYNPEVVEGDKSKKLGRELVIRAGVAVIFGLFLVTGTYLGWTINAIFKAHDLFGFSLGG